MGPKRLVSCVVLFSVLAAPLTADAGQRRRSDDRDGQSEEQRESTGRAVPRARSGGARPEAQRLATEAQRPASEAQRPAVETSRQSFRAPQQSSQAPRASGDSRAYRDTPRSYQDSRRSYGDSQRSYNNVRPDYRGDRYDGRRDYVVGPPQRYYYPYYANRGWGSRTIIVPRVVYPRFVAVAPYRPYVYRPSIGVGVYYGTGGAYPYGYVPRGYYEPIVGRPYGGLRITDMPRSAQVFADGYYVGIVDDFDGIFQHLNLEAGPHRIEIVEPGVQPLAFDVMIQAGRTMTFRVD